jgi:hypothetical protein
MKQKVCIPLFDEEVAPRFDLATEVLLAELGLKGRVTQEKVLILPGPSSERLCHLILSESAGSVVCGGIDQEIHDYLCWKQINVIDNVIGPSRAVLKRFALGRLNPGDILRSF